MTEMVKGRNEAVGRLKPNARRFLVFGVVLAVFMAGWLIRGVKIKSWLDYTDSSIHRLAVFVETYKLLQGTYPGSLDEMLKDPDLATNSSLLPLVLSKDGNEYSYVLSNGAFILAGSNLQTWFIGKRGIQERFPFGKAIE